MTKGQSILPKPSAKAFCQNVLPKHSAKTYYQNILQKHSAQTFCPNILPKHSAKMLMFFQSILPKHTTKTFCQNILPKHSAKTFCQNVLLKCSSKVFCHILSKFSTKEFDLQKSILAPNELKMCHSTFGFRTNFLIFALAECEKCIFGPLLLLAQPFLWSWNKQLAGRDCLKTHHKLSFKNVSANNKDLFFEAIQFWESSYLRIFRRQLCIYRLSKTQKYRSESVQILDLFLIFFKHQSSVQQIRLWKPAFAF